MEYSKDIAQVLITKEQLQKRVEELGKQISEDYKGEKLTLICILRGASVFFADLLRQITLPCEIDFIAVSSYGAGTTSSGEVKLVKDLSSTIDGENVIIVEDIMDTGVTLSYLKRMLQARNPKSIKICACVDKPERRKVDLKADYIGFAIPNEFIVGYGLDYNERYRNLPDICILAPEVYSEK